MSENSPVEFVPPMKKQGRVTGLYKAAGDNFVTEPCDRLDLTFEGIRGDIHAGLDRKSGGREPWYERGTLMRNERQLSILSVEELREVATDLRIDELKPGWIGGNLLLEGIPHLSLLPARTILFFEGGVSIRVDGDNGPCRISGRSIAAQFDGREDIEFEFPTVARHRRGLVGWVERPGTIEAGEGLTARIWKQWIYKG